MRNGLRALALGGALLAGAPGQAATLFFEDFSEEATAFGSTLNFTGFDQFAVSAGTVDLIRSGGFGITCATVGCVDLDGSTGNAGLLSAPFGLQGGLTYTISAFLSGNQRTGATETIEFGIAESGGTVAAASTTVSLAPGSAFAEYTLSYTPVADVTGSLFFQDFGNDNIGAILDRVSIASDGQTPPPIPLPAPALLLLGGLGGLGALRAARRVPA